MPGDDIPDFIRGDILHEYYDGKTNDLLTGGLGSAGLANANPPPFANPAQPTAAELRTRAIHANYRALVDMTPGGGYGTLYGPAVGIGGLGMIAGHEYLALADSGGGERVTIMVQVPDSFGIGQTCIVTAPSSGSRGVYGAIATAGEWGLKRGCAVAYTDKGTGMGVHDLSADTVNLITGERVPADLEPRPHQFPRRSGRGGARGVQLGLPQPAGLETRAFPRQSGKPLGPGCAGFHRTRLRRPQHPPPRPQRPAAHPG